MMENPGVYVISDFVTEAEEADILSILDLYPGKDRQKGPARMFRFGHLNITDGIKNDTLSAQHGYRAGRRSYGQMNDGIDVSVPEIPPVFTSLGQKLIEHEILDKLPPIYVVNKYLAGQGIAKHIDHFDNGPVIPVLGLKSSAVMRLTRGDEVMNIDFPRRALLVLKDSARYEWFHSILPCKEERYALVFRNLPG